MRELADAVSELSRFSDMIIPASSESDMIVPTPDPVPLLNRLATLSVGRDIQVLVDTEKSVSKLMKRLPDAGRKAVLEFVLELLLRAPATKDNRSLGPYLVFVRFIKDRRCKVRKQCTYGVIALLKTGHRFVVSEHIIHLFEHIILKAGRGTNIDHQVKGAQQLLYILRGLKGCLPLMSSDDIGTVSKHCVSLLSLRLPLVSDKIQDILYRFFSSPQSKAIDPKLLLKVLWTFRVFVKYEGIRNRNRNMRAKAKLLHGVMSRVHKKNEEILNAMKFDEYKTNKEMCMAMLPIIFKLLGGLLCHAAPKNDLRDVSLSFQGLIKLFLNEGMVGDFAVTTLVEKSCERIQKLMRCPLRYFNNWKLIFLVLSQAFHSLGKSSVHLFQETICKLADMEMLPHEDFKCYAPLRRCTRSAIQVFGHEMFLNIWPLDLESEDLSKTITLLEILKESVIGSRISYFIEHFVVEMKNLKQRSHKHEKELVESIWSTMPAFCNYPVDTSSCFKDLKDILIESLGQNHDLHVIVCKTLLMFIKQNTGKGNQRHRVERKAEKYYTPTITNENLRAIRQFFFEFFSILFEVLCEVILARKKFKLLKCTILEFASLSEPEEVKKAIKLAVQKLLDVSEESSSDSEFLCRHLWRLIADLHQFCDKEVGTLLREIRPQDAEKVRERLSDFLEQV